MTSDCKLEYKLAVSYKVVVRSGIERSARAASEAQNPELDMVGVTSGDYFSLYGGGGQDTARLRDVAAQDGVFARMGSGNDTLELNSVDTLGTMYLNGGDGIDTLIRSADSTAQTFHNW